MKKTISLFLVIVLCFSIMPTYYASAENASFSDDPKAIQVASNSVIMLSCYDKDGNLYATGSAFAAFEEGVFITNCHVIKDEVYSVRAAMETGLEFNISSVVAYDDERDLAILRTEAKTGLEPLPLGSTAALERAGKVIAIGSPLGLINTISIGLYSGTIKNENQQTFLQFSAPISHGSSGGALFNDKGEVVGITSASFTEGQNLNLAIPIEDAIELWDKRDSSAELSIPEFYDLWEHIAFYSVSDIIFKTVEYPKFTSVYTEGYVFVNPYSNNTVYLVETLSDYNALNDALEELSFFGGPLYGLEELDAKYNNGKNLDDNAKKRFEAQQVMDSILASNAIQITTDTSTDTSSIFHGNYVLIQGEAFCIDKVTKIRNVSVIG